MTEEKPDAEVVDSTAEEVESRDVVPDSEPPAELTPDEAKPSERELAVVKEIAEVDVFRAFDRADELIILDELAGRGSAMLEVMVYSFGEGRNQVTDLSVSGVNEAVRVLNGRMGHRIKISDRPPIVSEVREEDEDWYRVMVYAEDEADGSGAWGTAVEPKHIEIKKGPRAGQKLWDKFALTKALNKAERNAKKKLIPEEYRQQIIARYLQDESRVKRLAATTGGDVDEILLPPATGEEAEALRTRARELQELIVAQDRTKLLPGRFNALFARANSAVETLDAFVKWLETQLVEAGGEVPPVDAEEEDDQEEADSNG